jgi:hypothetical protein
VIFRSFVRVILKRIVKAHAQGLDGGARLSLEFQLGGYILRIAERFKPGWKEQLNLYSPVVVR